MPASPGASEPTERTSGGAMWSPTKCAPTFTFSLTSSFADARGLKRVESNSDAHRLSRPAIRSVRIIPAAVVEDRERSGHDHLVGRQLAAGGRDAHVLLAAGDGDRAAALEHVRAAARDRLGERDQVAARVELGLVLDPDRGRDRPREVRL